MDNVSALITWQHNYKNEESVFIELRYYQYNICIRPISELLQDPAVMKRYCKQRVSQWMYTEYLESVIWTLQNGSKRDLWLWNELSCCTAVGKVSQVAKGSPVNGRPLANCVWKVWQWKESKWCGDVYDTMRFICGICLVLATRLDNSIGLSGNCERNRGVGPLSPWPELAEGGNYQRKCGLRTLDNGLTALNTSLF